MTVLDPVTDCYLDRVGGADDASSWDDVVRRSRRLEQRRRRVRTAVVGGTTAAVAAGALAGVGVIGGAGDPSLVEKAQAAAFTGLPPAGTIVHIRDDYRDASGHAFITYEAWVSADGSWCRGVVEEPVTDYTLCQAGGAYELYLPQANEILRGRPAGGSEAPDSGFLADLDDFLATFRLEIDHQAGTMILDGVEYPKLETAAGDAVLVDPENGEAIAWIPSPEAFGKETIVRRTDERLEDTPAGRRGLSLEAQHPDATVRDVSIEELNGALAEQYPLG